MTTTRALAVAAYLAAVAAPASADWRTVADQLHAALPATRKALATAVDSAAPASAPRWFADWKLGKVYSLDSVAVTFADGVTIRVNLAKAPGKLPRVAASCRTAVAFYRAHTGRDTVPAFASIITASDGSEFDAEACSRLTADIRRTGIVPRAVRPAVTAEAVVRMEREVERRRAGLAAGEAAIPHTADKHVPLCLSPDGMAALHSQRRRWQESAELVPAWREAIAAGEAELAAMRAALTPSPEPVAAPCEPEAAPPAVAAEPVPADNDDAPVPPMPGAPAPAVAAVSADAAPCEAPVGILTGEAPEAIGEADPADAEPLAALCSDDDWTADESTHPVIALCLSDKARAALFDRLQDGTFPETDRTAKGGAWRLTVADAEECAGLASVRFVGLPRKSYTRRAAPSPVVTIAVPPEAIRTVPAAAFVPGSTPPGPVVYHAAPTL